MLSIPQKLSLLFIAAILAGCSSGSSSISTGFKIVNNGSLEIVASYVSPTSSTEWGDNRGSIPPGSSRTIQVAGGDFYDIRLVFADADEAVIPNEFVFTGEIVTFTYTETAGISVPEHETFLPAAPQ